MCIGHGDLGSQLASFPKPPAEPQGHIHDALDCVAGDRVDVVGLLLEMKELETCKKIEAWLKDAEDGKMILVELWGEAFFQIMATAEPGRTV